MKTIKTFLKDCKVGDRFCNIYHEIGEDITGSTIFTITHIDNKHIAVQDDWNYDIHALTNLENTQVDLIIEDNNNITIKTAKDVVSALEHQLYDQGDACHEIWNGWICSLNPYEIADYLNKYQFNIVGFFKLSESKLGLDIGIVIEQNADGSRSWCHAKKTWFDDWKEEYPELYLNGE